MSEDDSTEPYVRCNPKICALLRQGRGAKAPPPPPQPSVKRLVGSTVVQRLRQENYQLSMEEFLQQLDAPHRVPQETALNYYVHRTYNSLRSREMLAKEAKEATRLRREPYAQALAKDISRRHFRTARRFDTGSKYPPGGDPDMHSREAQDPVLTLLHSRKLLAMADVLLAHPGSVRVALQPSTADTAAAVGQRRSDGSPKTDPVDWDQQQNTRASGGQGETGWMVPQVIAVPSLDATRYALALFSPRHGHRVPVEASRMETDTAKDPVAGVMRSSRAKSAGVLRPPPRSEASEHDEADGVDGFPAAGRHDDGQERTPLKDEDQDAEGETASGHMDATIAAVAAEGKDEQEQEDRVVLRPGAVGTLPRAAEEQSSSPAAVSQEPDSASATAGAAMLPGGDREGVPVGVRQLLLGDKLQELLAASRGLFAQAESVLGARDETNLGGLAGQALHASLAAVLTERLER